MCIRDSPCVAVVCRCSPSEPLSVFVFPLSVEVSFASSTDTVRTEPTLLASRDCDQLIESRVQTLVDDLLIRIGVEPVEDLARAQCERNRADELRHQRLD